MGQKIIASNKKARFEHEIIQKFEAGIVLKGTEVKSLRLNKANINDGYCKVDSMMEVFLMNTHIAQYEYGNRMNHQSDRSRKLLLHKYQIKRLYGQVREKGLTLVPLSLYFKNGQVKVEIALVKGKKIHDKRESLKKKTAQRDMERSLKNQ